MAEIIDPLLLADSQTDSPTIPETASATAYTMASAAVAKTLASTSAKHSESNSQTSAPASMADANVTPWAARKHKQPRKSAAGRQLIRWDADLDQFLLLALDATCIELGIALPWTDVAKKIAPFATDEAIKQHLAKLYKTRQENGFSVPPKPTQRRRIYVEEVDAVSESESEESDDGDTIEVKQYGRGASLLPLKRNAHEFEKARQPKQKRRKHDPPTPFPTSILPIQKQRALDRELRTELGDAERTPVYRRGASWLLLTREGDTGNEPPAGTAHDPSTPPNEASTSTFAQWKRQYEKHLKPVKDRDGEIDQPRTGESPTGRISGDSKLDEREDDELDSAAKLLIQEMSDKIFGLVGSIKERPRR